MLSVDAVRSRAASSFFMESVGVVGKSKYAKYIEVIKKPLKYMKGFINLVAGIGFEPMTFGL